MVAAALGTAVPIIRDVVEGPEDRVLTAAAKGARMLVLGSHGYGHLHHAVVGSVSQACIRRSTCPVVVVPASASSVAEPVAAA